MLFVIQSFVLAPGIFGLCLYQIGDCIYFGPRKGNFTHLLWNCGFLTSKSFPFFSPTWLIPNKSPNVEKSGAPDWKMFELALRAIIKVAF